MTSWNMWDTAERCGWLWLSAEICRVIAIHPCKRFCPFNLLVLLSGRLLPLDTARKSLQVEPENAQNLAAPVAVFLKRRDTTADVAETFGWTFCLHRFSVVKNGMESLGPTAKHLNSLPIEAFKFVRGEYQKLVPNLRSQIGYATMTRAVFSHSVVLRILPSYHTQLPSSQQQCRR